MFGLNWRHNDKPLFDIWLFVYFRVFVLLLAMGQKSLSGPSAVSIMESLLDMLARVLSPLVTEQAGTTTFTHLLEHRYVSFKMSLTKNSNIYYFWIFYMYYVFVGMVDLTLVGWILLFLCRSLDHSSVNDDCSKASRKDGGKIQIISFCHQYKLVPYINCLEMKNEVWN